MKYLVRSIALFVIILALVGCSEAAGEAEVSLEAVIDTVSRSTRSSDTEVSRNITPSTYKIALTYFALIRKDGAVIPIIDEDAPEVYDFSGRFTTPLLLGRKRIPVGEYTGYEMRFTYLEMDLECSFSVPSWSTDADTTKLTKLTDRTDLSGLEYDTSTIRLYFNDDGAWMKRDIIVNTAIYAEDPPQWQWMRAELESNGSTSFFLHTRPVSVGSGPTQVINLFDDPDFWGSSDILTIRSGETVGGGMRAYITPFSISRTTKVVLTIDISNSFNFWEDTTSAFHNSSDSVVKLDFGPSCREVPTDPEPIVTYQLGDKGFHPFMPSFSLVKMP